MITSRTIIAKTSSYWLGVSAKQRIAIATLVFIVVISASGLFQHRWRTWQTDEVPVAFWAWHSDCPGEDDVIRAIKQARAQTLLLRAGQIDLEGGKLRRIRAVNGRFPNDIDIHLVYNATRSCLAEFERLNAGDLATVISKACAEDISRAERDHARVAGVQLDFDVPTRLLPSYTKLLKEARELLPPTSKLSITGLPTWMESSSLRDALDAVDFWIPQCYGAHIPETLTQSQSQPVSSLREVASAITKARLLNRPYYAGLAAYGYAIQYARDGSLIALHGDLDPASVVSDSNLELMSRSPFEQSHEPPAGTRWRCLYRARKDEVIDGTALQAMDYVMLDVPTSGSLRESSKTAREQGGDRLLGICVFRLPRQDDPTSLTIKEVAAALSGEEPSSSFQAEAKVERELDPELGVVSSRLRLSIVNDGSASSMLDAGAMRLRLSVPNQNVSRLTISGFDSAQSQREEADLQDPSTESTLRPCSLARANVLALSAKIWRPEKEAWATLEFAGDLPEALRATMTLTLDDGRVIHQAKTIKLEAARQR
jgi:hypothetical protein